MKKLILLPLIFVLAHVLYISCMPCDCPEIKERFFQVDNLMVEAYGSNKTAIDPGPQVNSTDSLLLKYYPVIRCVASTNPFSSLVNAAYACSCAQCGTDGPKYDVRTIMVTSDSVYNGRPANSSLNDVFRVLVRNISGPSTITIDSLKSTFNTGLYNGSFTLFTTEKPTDARAHRFTLVFTTQDNTTKTAATNRIHWQ